LADEDQSVLLTTRVLIESFSVMTRLPAPYRLDARDGMTLLAKTFEGKATLVDQPAVSYWDLLRDLVVRGASGGSVYDAEIIECARRAGATRILTLNKKHFDRLAPDDVEIASPYELTTAD
jgi:predicted nucleic acid-binding protein